MLEKLCQFIIQHYNEKALTTLCDRFGILYDELYGDDEEAKEAKVKVENLVIWLGRRKQCDELKEVLHQDFPDEFQEAELGEESAWKALCTEVDEYYKHACVLRINGRKKIL